MKGKRTFKVTLIRMERTAIHKTINADSVFSAFDKAKEMYEEPYKDDGKGGGYGVLVDNVEPMEGDK